MSVSNCSFLTSIQISQEAGQVVWYSLLFQNFPQFVVIHTVKGFDVVNKAEVDVFLKLSCYFYDLMDIGSLISGSSAFSKSKILGIYLKRSSPGVSDSKDFACIAGDLGSIPGLGKSPDV